MKYIVRAKDAGVFYGEVLSKSEHSITMRNVRKVWYWEGACAVEELAVNGTTKPGSCKLTVTVEEMEIADPIQIIAVTETENP